MADVSQSSTLGAVLPPATSSSGTTPGSSVLPQDITAAVASLNTSRSVTPTQCTGRYPIFVHSFQLSTIDPPTNGPILYVGTQLAGSTQALQQAISSRTPLGGITGVDIDIAIFGEFGGSPLNIWPISHISAMASLSSHHSGGNMHQVIQDVLHELNHQGLSAHFPAVFQECVPVAGTVPPCQEDRVPVDPMSCYYPESMVVIPRGEVFIHGLQDLIKDHPEWSVDHLICVCVSRLHHHHRAAGIIAVLTDVLSYSSSTLDNLVDHMYPQGAKPLWEIVPPGTQLVEHISTLVHNSDREVDMVEPADAQ